MSASSNFSLKKSERLCSKKAFEFLFAEGKSVYAVPLKLIFVLAPSRSESLSQVAFGVSKKNFKRANKRNKIKRLLREAYRKHKLSPMEGFNLYLMIIYTSKDILSLSQIENSMLKGLNEIKKRLEKTV
ncbi:MAG: ribonuclease P protein component [Bacteroidetes bacterium]|nr:ribonuclease P protein component [Bacteroidales bacterium]NJO70075.1 ribonuclease P protein component [Bacteroidota bacterium]